jgi:RNA polymerase sigma-70 factor (sigma-E family)
MGAGRTRRDRETEFAAFVTGRRTHLRRIAYALCGDWHQADDLVQTALARLYVAWPRVHGSPEAYTRQIIVRANIDESRRPWRREHPTDVQREAAVGADHSVEDRTELVVALQQLPAMQRRAVVLRHWLDLSVEETARELGISTGTVKSHTSRALARLHDLLVTDEPASALDRVRSTR